MVRKLRDFVTLQGPVCLNHVYLLPLIFQWLKFAREIFLYNL